MLNEAEKNILNDIIYNYMFDVLDNVNLSWNFRCDILKKLHSISKKLDIDPGLSVALRSHINYCKMRGD
jgi:hypothetical protein